MKGLQVEDRNYFFRRAQNKKVAAPAPIAPKTAPSDDLWVSTGIVGLTVPVCAEAPKLFGAALSANVPVGESWAVTDRVRVPIKPLESVKLTSYSPGSGMGMSVEKSPSLFVFTY